MQSQVGGLVLRDRGCVARGLELVKGAGSAGPRLRASLQPVLGAAASSDLNGWVL